jgi:phage shock protein A
MANPFKNLWTWFWNSFLTSTETQAIDQARFETNMRKRKERIGVAINANASIKTTMTQQADQISRQKRELAEWQAALDDAIRRNDEVNGPSYANSIAKLTNEIADNELQMQTLSDGYKENTKLIAEQTKQIQKDLQDYTQLKAKVAISATLEAAANDLMGSLQSFQGIGSESAEVLERMRTRALAGQSKMAAVKDVAAALGSSADARMAKENAIGRSLWETAKAKAASEKSPTTVNTPPQGGDDRQKIKVN